MPCTKLPKHFLAGLVFVSLHLCYIASAAHSTSNFAFYMGPYQLVVKELHRDDDNNLYISMKYLGFITGAKHYYNKKNNHIILMTPVMTLCVDTRFKLHSEKQLIFNDMLIDLPLVIKKTDDYCLLPLLAIADLLNYRVAFVLNGNKRYLTGLTVQSQQPFPEMETLAKQKASVRPITQKRNQYPENIPENGVSRKQTSFAIDRKSALSTNSTETKMKLLGFYMGLCHLKPDINGLNLDKTLSLFGSVKYRLLGRIALEFRYDKYQSSQLTIFPGEQADVTVKMRGLTGYLLYCFPRNMKNPKCEFDIGFGAGQYEIDFYHDSPTSNYYMRPKLATLEFKLGAEYIFTENWRTGFDIRGVFGNVHLNMFELGHSINIDLDGVYFGISQRYCF